MSLKIGKLKIGGHHGVSIDGHSLNPGEIAKQALGEVEKGANEALHHIEGAGNEALHHLEGAGNEALQKITGTGNDLLHGLETTTENALHAVKGASDKALHDIEGAAHTALVTVEHSVEHIRDEIFKGIAKQSIKKAVGWIEATLPDAFRLVLGPFSFAYENPAERLGVLRPYVAHPPGIGHVKDIVLALAPDVVTVSLSVELALVLLASDSLGVGFEADYKLKKFGDRYDAIRGQLGI